MRYHLAMMIAPMLALAACGSEQQPREPVKKIAVRSAEQDRLHQLDELNLAIALKRAIQTSGYPCKRVEKAGFVQQYENLDMWTATCSEGRNWAIFAAPDDSAQVRDCADVARAGLPQCRISKQPGSARSG